MVDPRCVDVSSCVSRHLGSQQAQPQHGLSCKDPCPPCTLQTSPPVMVGCCSVQSVACGTYHLRMCLSPTANGFSSACAVALCNAAAVQQVQQQQQLSPDCTLRSLCLRDTSNGTSHSVLHYHFHAWPDHGTPSSSSGIRAVCKHLGPVRDTGAPILVHCSAVGVQGRG